MQGNDVLIIRPLFREKTASQDKNVKSCRKVVSETKSSLNENGQEPVFLDDLVCISSYFYQQLLFGPLTCDLLGSYWILERGKEHKCTEVHPRDYKPPRVRVCNLAGSLLTHGGGSGVTKAEKDACSQSPNTKHGDTMQAGRERLGRIKLKFER